MLTFFYISFSSLVLKAGDIELNPGPKKIPYSYFSCCHCNVNSLAADNYFKVPALKAYNSTYKYDFICKDLMLDGYNLIRSGSPK